MMGALPGPRLIPRCAFRAVGYFVGAPPDIFRVRYPGSEGPKKSLGLKSLKLEIYPTWFFVLYTMI